MYEFYYDYLKPKYSDRCKLLFINTDSFETPDLYKVMSQNLDLFDTSNFETIYPLYTTKNHRVLSKFKSETWSLAPREFVGPRAKMYSLLFPDNPKGSKNRIKGIKKSYVKKVRMTNFSPSSKHSSPLPALSVPSNPRTTSCGPSKLTKHVLMPSATRDTF